jgi:hypothetical protein
MLLRWELLITNREDSDFEPREHRDFCRLTAAHAIESAAFAAFLNREV